MELWKEVSGYRGIFSVSSCGNIYSHRTNRQLKLMTNHAGYKVLSSKVLGKSVYKFVHRLVAKEFILQKEGKDFINHKDGCKSNNKYENLEWCTHSENMIHSFTVLGRKQPAGFKSKCFNLSEQDVNFILNTYKPRCRSFGARALAKQLEVHHTTILKVIKDFRE